MNQLEPFDLLVYCGSDAPYVHDKMRLFSVYEWTKRWLLYFSECLNAECALRICEFAFIARLKLTWCVPPPCAPREFLRPLQLSTREYDCLEKMRRFLPNLKILKHKVEVNGSTGTTGRFCASK